MSMQMQGGSSVSPVLRILVIDDNTLQLELLQRVLSRDGFAVAVGASMNDIKDLAKAFRPHVVLMDVNIPGAADGAGLPMARSAAPPGTRFYLFSACDESRLSALAREHRADGWLSKRMPVAEVSRKLRELSQQKPPSDRGY
jgi:DNA-binding response OmpR family regulator